jgi:carbamoyl-phosphate synthase large subunit
VINPTVLVTAVGGAGSVDVMRSLSETGRYRLIAADTSRVGAGFAFAARSYVVPFAADSRFEAVITRVLERERPQFVVSTVDEEIPIFHRLVAERFPNMKVVTPRAEFCTLMLDKWTSMEALRSAGISVPLTRLGGQAADITYPAIIKPRVGRGSRGLAYLESAADLSAYLKHAPAKADDFVVQQRLPGREYTVSGVVALGGPLLAVVPKEVLVKRGVTQIGVTRSVPAIDRVCTLVQERLRADGPFNAQLMLGPDGVPSIFELNPRYSTTTALTIAAGLNEVDVVIQRALGADVGRLTYRPDLAMVRHTAAMYVDETSWPVGEYP